MRTTAENHDLGEARPSQARQLVHGDGQLDLDSNTDSNSIQQLSLKDNVVLSSVAGEENGQNQMLFAWDTK